tara:strand:- start:3152 stop:3493 length:342 start_codon:yes stop_codon:yes gene_type:complete
MASIHDQNIGKLIRLINEANMIAIGHGIDLDIDNGEIIFYDGEAASCANFRASLKERQEGEPCFIEIEPRTNIGLDVDEPTIVFDMEQGTTFEDAKDLTSKLNRLCRLVEILS